MNTLKALIRNGNLKSAIEKLHNIVGVNNDFEKALYLIDYRAKSNEDKYHQGLKSSDEYNIENNKLVLALLKFIALIEIQNAEEVEKFGCLKCAQLIPITSTSCCECGAIFSDTTTCLKCLFKASKDVFASNDGKCPNCKFDGFSRTQEEKETVAKNLFLLTGQRGIRLSNKEGKSTDDIFFDEKGNIIRIKSYE